MKQVIDSTISKEIDSRFLDYSMYTLENRAIPSAIDGLKPVHRKLVYAMLTEHVGKKVKLADLSGISKYNYHHGESSAAGAAVTLTADWSNNCPLFTGHGNFGSRLVQEASAPRYIFATLSKDFKAFFFDSEVCDPSFDTENPEPRFYLPLIPWVLVNGISGIAVGFATNILPRSISDVSGAVKSYLKNSAKFLSENKPIKPTYPQFRGQITQLDDSQWMTSGIIEYAGKYTYTISELPIGYDRAAYVSMLNDMCDKDLIRDYTDECSEDGFGFSIKTTGAQKEKIDKDPMKYFKLQKTFTENLTTLGTDGKLKIFKSVAELIAYFCDFRLTKFGQKLRYDIDKLENEIIYLIDKSRFIADVVCGKIELQKTTKQNLIEYIETHITKAEYGKKYISIPIYECTSDSIKELELKVETLRTTRDELMKQTPDKIFATKLAGIK